MTKHEGVQLLNKVCWRIIWTMTAATLTYMHFGYIPVSIGIGITTLVLITSVSERKQRIKKGKIR